MSRIGRAPITVPTGVTCEIQAKSVVVKGPKATLTVAVPDGISVSQKDGVLSVAKSKDDKQTGMVFGTTRSLLNNAVVGVSQGWTKVLELVGVGYRASGGGTELTLQVGFSHPVKVSAPSGISFSIADNTKITVSGSDKKDVGEVSAKIRSIRPPEPYKGKGIRYQGEHVRKKLGKAVKAAGAA